MLIDPKRVELSIFNGLPHMLVKESISDADKVLNALNWLINEMDTRFNLFKAIGARNITEYNEAVLADKSAPKLPYIVVVVDEFGELMMAAKRDVESRILRLAQLARAAGIHLILATQRPSVDVITGTIKANLTSRIAFSVSSATDSKTILDYGGAEKLLGKGDMLYMVNGKTARLQGPFINGKEVREIVNFVKEHNDAYFDPAIEKVVNAVKEEFDSATVAEAPSRESELDEMFIPALKFIIREGKASISSLSTRFAIGYNRAARIIYNMEKQGYIGKAEGGAKARKVVITPFEFEEIFNESIDGDDEF
jgi:S-DNA-T family DNA segregation ATPase FtsK/SpoIIIE